MLYTRACVHTEIISCFCWCSVFCSFFGLSLAWKFRFDPWMICPNFSAYFTLPALFGVVLGVFWTILINFAIQRTGLVYFRILLQVQQYNHGRGKMWRTVERNLREWEINCHARLKLKNEGSEFILSPVNNDTVNGRTQMEYVSI